MQGILTQISAKRVWSRHRQRVLRLKDGGEEERLPRHVMFYTPLSDLRRPAVPVVTMYLLDLMSITSMSKPKPK